MYSLLEELESYAKETLSPKQLGEQVFTYLPMGFPGAKNPLVVRPTPKVYHIPTIGEAVMDGSEKVFKTTKKLYPYVADAAWQQTWGGKFFHEHNAFRTEIREKLNRKEDGSGDQTCGMSTDKTQMAVSVFFPSGKFGQIPTGKFREISHLHQLKGNNGISCEAKRISFKGGLNGYTLWFQDHSTFLFVDTSTLTSEIFQCL